MKHTQRERVIALAGLFQATSLVNQVARTGTTPLPEYETLIRSLFIMSPRTTAEIYGSEMELALGLRTLITQFGNDFSQRDVDKTRYAINLLQLERILEKNPATLNLLADELGSMEQQLSHFEPTHSNVIARLADIYLKNISPLGPRIIVSGEHNYLNNIENANKVRALLLTGIRAAVLWSQCGGSRWQLIFKRKSIVNEAKNMLA